jgi:hypothetical protein
MIGSHFESHTAGKKTGGTDYNYIMVGVAIIGIAITGLGVFFGYVFFSAYQHDAAHCETLRGNDQVTCEVYLKFAIPVLTLPILMIAGGIVILIFAMFWIGRKD